MEARLAAVEVVHSGPDLVATYARLRVACRRAGHGLAQARHDADRWLAATALRLDVPLVSDDGVFDDVPALRRERA